MVDETYPDRNVPKNPVDGMSEEHFPSPKDGETVVIGGRLLRPTDTIFDLTAVVEEGNVKPDVFEMRDDEIMKKVSEVAEKVARELFPSIAEKVIREEIEKLKKGGEEE